MCYNQESYNKLLKNHAFNIMVNEILIKLHTKDRDMKPRKEFITGLVLNQVDKEDCKRFVEAYNKR